MSIYNTLLRTVIASSRTGHWYRLAQTNRGFKTVAVPYVRQRTDPVLARADSHKALVLRRMMWELWHAKLGWSK